MNATVDDVVSCLLAGADPMALYDYSTPLHFAAADSDDPAVIVALLEAGANPDVRSENEWTLGRTPLHFAAFHNESPAAIAVLVEAGADPNAQDNWRETPLHRAAWNTKNPAVIVALLEGGADPSARDKYGKIPLDYARENDALMGSDAYLRLQQLS